MKDDVDDLIEAVPDLSIAQLSFNHPTPRWQERHSLHFYINYTAPQLSGFYHSIFWEKLIIQAAYHHESVLHGLVGLGSLHEGVVQAQSRAQLESSPQYLTALKHLNKAISALRHETKQVQSDQRVVLALCVLLTTFEAFQGRTSEAMTHASQGAKLIKARNGDPENIRETTPFPVGQNALAPILAHFNYHAAIYASADAEVIVDGRVELPAEFHSIDEAQNYLKMAKNAVTTLSVRIWRVPSDEERLEAVKMLSSYKPWLDQWKEVLDRFVDRERDDFTNLDVKRVLIITACHLFCVCAAISDHTAQTPLPYAASSHLFPQMIELCEACARIPAPPLPSVTNSAYRYLSYGLWIHEPLFIMKTFAVDPEIRRRAEAVLVMSEHPDSIDHAGPTAMPDTPVFADHEGARVIAGAKRNELDRFFWRRIVTKTGSIERYERGENTEHTATHS